MLQAALSSYDYDYDKNNVRFWRVEGFGGVSDVLRAMEHTECKTSQKVARRQITSNRTYNKSSLLCSVYNKQI